jgi:hypothetical protein
MSTKIPHVEHSTMMEKLQAQSYTKKKVTVIQYTFLCADHEFTAVSKSNMSRAGWI